MTSGGGLDKKSAAGVAARDRETRSPLFTATLFTAPLMRVPRQLALKQLPICPPTAAPLCAPLRGVVVG